MFLSIKALISSSVFIPFFKKLYIKYRHIDLWLDSLFENSRICNTIQNFWRTTKIICGYSFLGKISNIEMENYLPVLDNSKSLNKLLRISATEKNKISFYSGKSRVMAYIKERKKDLCLSPIKIGSIILISAILVNTLFSFLFYKEIKLLGWVMRGLFIIIALGGLSCKANWEDIKNTSFILRHQMT